MKVIGSSQHGFMKKQHLTNLTALYNEMTNLMDEERAMDVVYPRAFDPVSHDIIVIDKLMAYIK